MEGALVDLVAVVGAVGRLGDVVLGEGLGDFSSFEVTVREMTVPWRQRPSSPGQSYVPDVVITMSASMTLCGLAQPSRSGSVMPLSSSTTTDGSSADGSELDSEGEGEGSALVGADDVGVGAVCVCGSPSSPLRTTAPVTIAATSTTAAAVRAIAFARPEPPEPPETPVPSGTVGVEGVNCGCAYGCWGVVASGERRCSVQAVPSHQRSTCGAEGSRYHPGGGVMLIPAL